MGDRCTGHCCERFYLPYSPEDLQKIKENSIAVDRGEERPYPHLINSNTEEITKIADMAILVEYSNRWVGGDGHYDQNGDPVRGHYYTCKHFDPVSGNCTNYENRPKMCSEYPYGRMCSYRACTWNDARKMKLTQYEEDVARLRCDAEVTAVSLTREGLDSLP